MRILAHIHTLNDAAVIERLIAALHHQTRRPDAILIVDNASTDDTLDRVFPDDVAIIRNTENLGTSGAIRIGLAYALEHGFDWTWIFDADSIPDPSALEKLLVFFADLSPSQQKKTCFLAGWPLTDSGDIKQQPMLIGEAIEIAPLTRTRESTECDCVLWSGSLFRMSAVREIGLPSADYVLDIAEIEYGYRARQKGFTSYIIHDSIIHHDVGRPSGAVMREYRLGRLGVTFYELSPPRTYYSIRNVIYFWLYQHKPRHLSRALHWAAWRALPLGINFIVRPRHYGMQFLACLRGIWHGLTGNMTARY
jgi:GT2 family glycosyltransferase